MFGYNWTRILLLAIMFSFISFDGNPQKGKKPSQNYVNDTLKDQTLSLTVGNYYTNKVIYWGQDFGLKQYGITPYVLISHNNGLYLYVVNLYWEAIDNKPAETDIGIGYKFQLGNLYVYTSYERWLVHYGGVYNRRALSNYLEADLLYDFNIFNLESTSYYMWGIDKLFVSDIALNQQYYLFPLGKKGWITLTPEVLASFADQPFWYLFTDYYEFEEPDFRWVDFETNATLGMVFKKLELELTGHYNMPVNPYFEPELPFLYFTAHLNYILF